MKQRMIGVDNLRGLLTFVVILGHTIVGLRGLNIYYGTSQKCLDTAYAVIYSFHMPAFFMLSGFFFWQKHRNKMLSKAQFINELKNKFITLGITYVLYSILYWIIKFISSSFVDATVTHRDLLMIGIMPIEFMWYLYTLLIINLIALVMARLGIKQEILCMVAFIIAMLYNYDGGLYVLNFILEYMVYFYIGSVISSYSSVLQNNKKSILLILTIASFVSMFLYLKYPNNFVKFCTASLLSILLFEVFAYSEYKIPLLYEYGINAMPIYLLHVIFVGACRILLIKIGICNIMIQLVVGFVIPAILSYGLYACIIKKICFLDFIFYPGKYLIK